MKKLVTGLAFLLLLASLEAQPPVVSLIPEPVECSVQPGTWTMPDQLRLAVPDGKEAAWAAASLQERLKAAAGMEVQLVPPGSPADIRLELLPVADTQLGREGYWLQVDAGGVRIGANQAAGLFYGVQTLLQLMPEAIMGRSAVGSRAWEIPRVQIRDYPRFGWRGLMLDVSRHFFTKDEVKRFIDDMARYKFNLFHWHLTDDEGWRIEIKSLPRLTEVGAWNVKRVGTFGNFKPIRPDEPRTNGGYYTQDDIREVVQYARERFVDILPEIEMPGHSLAAIAAYPELSCTPDAVNYKVRSGEKIMDWSTRPATALVDNALCPANEKVYPFIDQVMTEVAALFPFPYIHTGGDECARNFWEKHPAIRALMQRENLKTMDAVQGYFENRVEKIVNSKGRKMIGWDEILEGDISPTAAIMSWRGTKGGIEAAARGHEVVMSPSSFVYLDYMQSDEIMEPRVYASLRLSKTYSYEPISEGIVENRVKGIQGNLWTEQMYTFRQVQYMAWPRAFAISETAWSPSGKKNWKRFVNKVEQHFGRLNSAGIKYSPALYDPDFKVSRNDKGELVVTLSTELDDLDLYYSFDNSYPDPYYPRYTGPLVVPEDASLLRVISYRGNVPVGRMNNMPVSELLRRAGKK